MSDSRSLSVPMIVALALMVAVGGGVVALALSQQEPSRVDVVLDRLQTKVAELEARYEEREAPEPAGGEVTSGPKPAPEPDSAHEVNVQEWIDRLADDSDDVAFRATVELAELGDQRAVLSLIGVMVSHRDFYVRLGAATALGGLKAFDAVPALIDALDDRDQLVRTSAADALIKITGNTDVQYLAGDALAERVAAMDIWRAWWAANEAAVRAEKRK